MRRVVHHSQWQLTEGTTRYTPLYFKPSLRYDFPPAPPEFSLSTNQEA